MSENIDYMAICIFQKAQRVFTCFILSTCQILSERCKYSSGGCNQRHTEQIGTKIISQLLKQLALVNNILIILFIIAALVVSGQELLCQIHLSSGDGSSWCTECSWTWRPCRQNHHYRLQPVPGRNNMEEITIRILRQKNTILTELNWWPKYNNIAIILVEITDELNPCVSLSPEHLHVLGPYRQRHPLVLPVKLK